MLSDTFVCALVLGIHITSSVSVCVCVSHVCLRVHLAAQELIGCFSEAAHVSAVATKLADLRKMGLDAYRRTVLQAQMQGRRASTLRFTLPTAKRSAPAPDRRLSMLKMAGVEGYLCVKSSGSPVWRDRYFVLDNEQLKWMTRYTTHVCVYVYICLSIHI
jgi:hypothetical protein